MPARRLATLLPARHLAAARETTRIHGVAGLMSGRSAVVTTRPLRAPHHTISDVGVIGSGQLPLWGEVSLAHHGLLLLDALPECTRHGLEVLRRPLETDLPDRRSRTHLGLRGAGVAGQTGDDGRGVVQGSIGPPADGYGRPATCPPDSPLFHYDTAHPPRAAMKEIIGRHRNRSPLAENFNIMPLDRPKVMPRRLKSDWH
jgi:Magnesium chelatase, subunit ChlI